MTTNRFVYRKRNPYNIVMRLWQPDIIETLKNILEPVGTAIKKLSVSFNNQCRTDFGDDETEAISDYACESIEGLLGVAFVVCQTHITSVVSNVKRLHVFFKAREKRSIAGFSDKKLFILRQGGVVVAGSDYTDIQTIDAFANYFKHREEWPAKWEKMKKGNPANMRDIILSCGGSCGSSGNLRTGAAILGNEDYHKVSVFADRLYKWHSNLYSFYSQQLKNEGIL
ncbi:MAG: hypothetical protein C0399_13085 [Syntrophus sp. (in: bacteria)]|nr:hypothetical protein [Syntrophus sp. (in: bacteria)]